MVSAHACQSAAHAAGHAGPGGDDPAAACEPGAESAPPEDEPPPHPAVRSSSKSAAVTADCASTCPSVGEVRLLYPRFMGGNYTPGGAAVRRQGVKVSTKTEGRLMTSVKSRVLVAAAVFALLAVAAGCGGDSSNDTGGGGGAQAGDTVSASTCGKAIGSGEFTIVSDFPLQGSSSHQTKQMNQAIQLVLEQHNFKAGGHTLQFQACDDSTAQLGSWDSATCSSNANSYAGTKSLIGVIGTFNS